MEIHCKGAIEGRIREWADIFEERGSVAMMNFVIPLKTRQKHNNALGESLLCGDMWGCGSLYYSIARPKREEEAFFQEANVVSDNGLANWDITCLKLSNECPKGIMGLRLAYFFSWKQPLSEKCIVI